MDIMTIFDVIIFVFGFYMIGAGWKMKRTGKLSSLIIAEEEMHKCKDEAGMAEFLCWRETLFGAVFVLVGGMGIVNDLWIDLGLWNVIEMAIFVAAFIWFMGGLRKAREKYFRQW